MRSGTGRSVSSVVKVVLDVMWYVGTIALALAALLLLLSVVTDRLFEGRPGSARLGVPVSFELDLSGPGIAAPSLGIEGARIQGARGTLNIPTRRSGFLFANIAILIGLLALGLWMVGQLRAVFSTVRAGRPFVPANARRIRWVGVGVITGQLAFSAITFFENYYAMTHFSAAGIRFAALPTVNVVGIVHGLVILAIAEVFRAGTRLEEDQSLTI